MSTYAQHVSTRQTPQSEKIPGSSQVENSSGGYSWGVDCWTRLERFLILGCEQGSYYATARKLTQENAQALRECADADPARAVRLVVEISRAGRAPKNDPAVFALAFLASHPGAKEYALAAVSDVCRIGTHLFQFVSSVQHFRGWGRGLREAVAAWYTGKTPQALAYQLAKYQNREGWTHRDVLRKCHARSENEGVNLALGWAVGKREVLGPGAPHDLTAIAAMEMAQRAKSAKEVAGIIREYNLVRECVPTEHLNSVDVWDALLEQMPMTAMLRNLGKMSSVGLLKPMSDACTQVVNALSEAEVLLHARVHPMSILLAKLVYARGQGVKGSLTWAPDSSVLSALDDAFYLAFGAVEPTGKRHLLALDVSGSMGWSVINGVLDCRQASAAMAMVTVQREQLTHVTCFSHQLEPLPFERAKRLDDAVRIVSNRRFGRTDCALPMLYASRLGIEVDTFVIYTDSETWAGQVHPAQALQKYRDKMGIPAKLIVVGMVSNGFTIADPNDRGMLDVVGFDTNVPAVMADFSKSA